jgi:hypothetical protein
MSVLDSSVTNIALPTIARDLASDPAKTVWVVTAYQIAIVMSLLPVAALGERYGYLRIYATGLIIFVAMSLACTFAPSLELLAVFRFAQGFGAAAMMGVNGALMRYVWPKSMLGRGVGYNAMVIACTAAAGPGLAGLILALRRLAVVVPGEHPHRRHRFRAGDEIRTGYTILNQKVRLARCVVERSDVWDNLLRAFRSVAWVLVMACGRRRRDRSGHRRRRREATPGGRAPAHTAICSGSPLCATPMVRRSQVALLDLEAPDIFRRRRVGRAPQGRCKPPDVADVVALRLVAEPAYIHLVD